MTIKLTGLAVGSLAGIILNAVLPGKDYVFEDKQQAAQAKDETLKPEPAEPEGVKKIHKK
jgi:uracil permease